MEGETTGMLGSCGAKGSVSVAMWEDGRVSLPPQVGGDRGESGRSERVWDRRAVPKSLPRSRCQGSESKIVTQHLPTDQTWLQSKVPKTCKSGLSRVPGGASQVSPS